MQRDPIRVFVGTCPEMAEAEVVLEHSIRSRTQAEVAITWMRAGEGLFAGWRGYKGRAGTHDGWYTPFTCFRMAVPELAEFRGTAIYLDADMVVLRDLSDLLDVVRCKVWETVGGRTDVSVIDCAAIGRQPKWPTIADLRASTRSLSDYTGELRARALLGTSLPAEWDCYDGSGLNGLTGVLHFNNMHTQPWRPFPDVFRYPPHPSPAALAVWTRERAAAFATRKVTT